MSEFTNHQTERLEKLNLLFDAIVHKRNPVETIKKHQKVIDNAIPEDVVILVHNLMEAGVPMEVLKTGINKFLNVLHKPLEAFPFEKPAENSFFDICLKNNAEALKSLGKLRPLIAQINKNPDDKTIAVNLIRYWTEVQNITQYYTIKENVIFPLVEKHLKKYRCIAVMWSIHDDIRRNISEIITLLSSDTFDLQKHNQLTGDTFFQIYTIVFREEKLLYPFITKHIESGEIEKLWNESVEIGFPYINPEKRIDSTDSTENIQGDLINLKSGDLTADQIILVFSHLPVDITFVDENNKVRFFSTPKKRIFTRTNAIIGRDVKNCHPHESVHVVEKIVEAFRQGTKDKADFWINMKDKRILIQYFAVRNERNEYKGVIEVTQEISEIQQLEGERRILDWQE